MNCCCTSQGTTGAEAYRQRQVQLAEAHGARKTALRNEQEKLAAELGHTRDRLGSLRGANSDARMNPDASSVASRDSLEHLVKDLTSDAAKDAALSKLAVLRGQIAQPYADKVGA